MTIESVVGTIKEQPRGAKLLVAGTFKENILDPEGDWRGEEIVLVLATEGLEDISAHFFLRRRSCCWDTRTCITVQVGREVISRTDYILGTYLRLF